MMIVALMAALASACFFAVSTAMRLLAVGDDRVQLAGHLGVLFFERGDEADGHAEVDADHPADRVDGAAAFVERLDQLGDLALLFLGQLALQNGQVLLERVGLDQDRGHASVVLLDLDVAGLVGEHRIELAVDVGDPLGDRLDLHVLAHVALDDLLERGGLAALHDDRAPGHQGQHEQCERRREADFDDQRKIDEPEGLHRICPLLRRYRAHGSPTSRVIIRVYS
jgi:hypothetical protein